jgi:small GTP-binding protein
MESSILEKVRETEHLFENYEIIGNELARVRQLREKLESQHMTVSVIGQFKRGKSALVNRILGENILPVGIIPVTAVVTTVDYGPKAAQVHFSNGLVKNVEFDEISAFVNEQENQDNRLNVTKVSIQCQSEFLKSGLTFVDTPGVGSMHEKNSEEAYSFVKESDAVIFTLSVDSPINQIEIDFLKNAKEYAAKFYFAVNKIDAISETDLDAYLAYCKKFISGLMEVEDIMLFPVSAKVGTGVEALKTHIADDLASGTSKILEESTKLKLHDIVMSALQQISFYRAALSLTGKEFEEKFSEMKEFFEVVTIETRTLPESLKNNKVVCEAHANDIKNRLTAKVKELFGIDYHYEIDEVQENITTEGEADVVAQVAGICNSLDKTLNTIFMYREENTYVVSKRIYDMNRLVRQLVRMRG